MLKRGLSHSARSQSSKNSAISLAEARRVNRPHMSRSDVAYELLSLTVAVRL